LHRNAKWCWLSIVLYPGILIVAHQSRMCSQWGYRRGRKAILSVVWLLEQEGWLISATHQSLLFRFTASTNKKNQEKWNFLCRTCNARHGAMSNLARGAALACPGTSDLVIDSPTANLLSRRLTVNQISDPLDEDDGDISALRHSCNRRNVDVKQPKEPRWPNQPNRPHG
jgi:hypothetical protein